MARPGKPRKLPEAVWALVSKELSAGMTYEQAQAELLLDGYDVSIPTLARYRAEDNRRLRAAGKVPPPIAEQPALERLKARAAGRLEPPAGAPVDEAEPASVDVETMLRRQLRDATARAERARSLGDAVVAAREAKVCAELTNQLARAQRDARGSRDTLSFSRANIEQTRRGVLEKVAAIVQRPLMCAGCARSLAAALAGVSLEPPAAVG